MTDLDPRTPVLVGVGTAAQTIDEPGGGLEAADLMAEAARAAADDAGVRSLLGAVQQVAVPKGTWSYTDPGRLVAARIGAAPARTVLVEVGVSQQWLVSDALSRIRAGELDVALVVGGDAHRRALRARRAGGVAVDTDQVDATPDELVVRNGEFLTAGEIDARLWDAVVGYAMFDNALRAAEGLTIAQHLDEIDALWAAFNRVARDNPRAAFPEARDAATLRTDTPDNRLLAFPYRKWHSTQWTVDQAGALLLCSVEAARRHDVARDRWVFPHVALDSSFMAAPSRRRDLHRWPAMHVLGRVAARHLGRPVAEAEYLEAYSCFPAAVRVQQRELDLLGRAPATLTVTGGMAFAGGPLNNFTYQASQVLIERVRAEPGSLGILTTVSGLLHKPGLAAWSTMPHPDGVCIADCASEVAAVTEVVDADDEYSGPATVVSYTVTVPGDAAPTVTIIADTDGDRRTVARRDDADLAILAQSEELIGARVQVRDRGFGLDGRTR